MQTLELTKKLVALPSITPKDAGCQDLMANYLQNLGFAIKRLRFGEVDNIWATHGTSSPLVVFAGHTDVVPPGPVEDWNFPAFVPTIKDGLLYGRGTADMKGAIAAMLAAANDFILANPQHQGTIGFLITSDEEGVAEDGTAKVMEYLNNNAIYIDYCLIGEPSSTSQLGDTIKIGRRGSLTGNLQIFGQQGHVAYPQFAKNPIHESLAFFQAFINHKWGMVNPDFPATSLQIVNMHSGVGAANVIPGVLEVLFNFRYNPSVTAMELKEEVQKLLKLHGLKYAISWQHNGEAFLSKKGPLLTAAMAAISKNLTLTPELSTSGGTSDGRFIAPTGAEVIELGLCNATIHKANECVAIADLKMLTLLYRDILQSLLVN